MCIYIYISPIDAMLQATSMQIWRRLEKMANERKSGDPVKRVKRR